MSPPPTANVPPTKPTRTPPAGKAQGAQIRFAVPVDRRWHRNHENSECQEQQAEEVHEDGTVDPVRDDSGEEES